MKLESKYLKSSSDKNSYFLNSLLISKIAATGIMNALFVKKRSSKLAAYSNEEIGKLLDTTEDIIKRTVNRISDGNFNADPTCTNKKYPCEYCAFAAICRQRRYSRD